MSCGPLPPPKNQTSSWVSLSQGNSSGSTLWLIVHGPLKATVLSYNVDMFVVFFFLTPCWEGSILQKLRNPWNYVSEGHASKV